ncbi:uncharacterized protein LOC109713202 [Ananas comosus]|uniref:Uncharacterized protein LOC109713202 n=1 Tax=Ananas comosus TaxID=4615 RepID=A0A6P5FB15_ANACO|nr:uncharacterized protein LOC109713202 [Ananas comosus]
MEYERIHKVQVGAISPGKLSMRLFGSHHIRKQESANNSSRASPSKLDDTECSRKSLLAEDPDETYKLKDNGNASPLIAVENSEASSEALSGVSTVEFARSSEEDGNMNDNRNSYNFEFQREKRGIQHSVVGSFIRQVPSKWNDAEKWIVNRHIIYSNPNVSKRTASESRGTCQVTSNLVRVAPEFASAERKNHRVQKTVTSAEQSVSTRDIGTAMTPTASQDPSRTNTPIRATTPAFSPPSSLPSTPKRARRISTPSEENVHNQKKVCTADSSERELQLKIRREIAALGLQLGKMNIASWATKDELMQASPSIASTNADCVAKMEFETRAVAWQESQKSKYTAKHKHDEIKIQAWESHQRAKFEAKMRKVEARAEQMKARAQQRMVEKLTKTRLKVDAKKATLDARRDRQVVRLARQVEKIRQTGHVPSSLLRPFLGCFLSDRSFL